MGTFYVNYFEAVPLANSQLLLSGVSGATVIVEAGQHQLVEHLLAYRCKHLTESALRSLCLKLGVELAAIEPLEKRLGVLKRVSALEGLVQRISLRGVHDKAIELLRNDMMLGPMFSTDEHIDAQVILIHLPLYQPEVVRNVYEQLTVDSSMLVITSYFLNDLHVVDGPYIKNECTPCHFCNILNWEQLEFDRVGRSGSGWYPVFNFMSRNNVAVRSTVAIDGPRQGAVAFHLALTLKKYVGVEKTRFRMDEATGLSVLRLDDGTSYFEPSMHSRLCECIDTSFSTHRVSAS